MTGYGGVLLVDHAQWTKLPNSNRIQSQYHSLGSAFLFKFISYVKSRKKVKISERPCKMGNTSFTRKLSCVKKNFWHKYE